MALHFEEKSDGRRLAILVTERLTGNDFDYFLRAVRYHVVAHESLDVLVVLDNLAGVDIAAMWAAMCFSLRHRSRIGRLAVVGDQCYQRWIASAGRILTGATVRYFETSQAQDADAWLNRYGHALPNPQTR